MEDVGPKGVGDVQVASLTRIVLARAVRIGMTREVGEVVLRTEETLVPTVCRQLVVYELDEHLLRPLLVQSSVPDHEVDPAHAAILRPALEGPVRLHLTDVLDARSLALLLPPELVAGLDEETSAPCTVGTCRLDHEGRTVGVLLLLFDGPEPPDDERRAVAEIVADVLGTAIDQARQWTLSLEVQSALADAAVMRHLPLVPGYELAAELDPSTPGSPVGGDWIDVLQLDERVVFAVGDVVGHGLAAASWMAQLRHALRAYLVEGHGPDVSLDLLNRFADASPSSRPATVLVGELRPDDGRVRFARAGHPPPIVAGGEMAIADLSPDPPIGTLRAHQHVLSEVTLRSGELLVAYTDGLVERRGRDLDTQILELAREVSTWPVSDAKRLLELLIQRVRDDVERNDDVAILVLGRLPDRIDRMVEAVALDLAAVADLRVRASAWLRKRKVQPHVIADVALAISELGANAVAATVDAQEIAVAIALDDQRVTVSVSNQGQPFERSTAMVDPLAASGRGLRMLDGASDRLEVEHADGITMVSCVFVRG